MTPRRPAATIRRVERASGTLAAEVVARMDESLPWFRAMAPEQRSWVGLVAQTGIATFVEWLRRPEAGREITNSVFSAAPRELARAITLMQTVELVRLTVDVVETRVSGLAAPGEEALLRESVLRYSREIAFAAAEAYATAAEQRGTWDARLEALVVDALLRDDVDDALVSRAAALGWGSPSSVAVIVGSPPRGADQDLVLEGLHRAARHAGLDVLAGVHGDRLVAVLGGASEPLQAARRLLPEFGDGPVVLGPSVPDLATAGRSAKAALSGARAAAAWPAAPRPVAADFLLAERALAGDETARRALVEEIYIRLESVSSALLDTVSTYLDQGGSLEATARALFLHPNTVRYRLRKVAEVCGYTASEPRQAFTMRVALALGRMSDFGEPVKRL